MENSGAQGGGRSFHHSVLLVDDETALLRSVARIFSKQSVCHLFTAASAEDALAFVAKESVDLVLLDIHFGAGRMDGIACVRALRERGYTGLIWMLTSDESSARLLEAAVAGADDFLFKDADVLCGLQRHLNELVEVGLESRRDAAPLRNSLFLRSRGLCAEQIDLLASMSSLGFPREGVAAERMGITYDALAKRLCRIRERLGVGNTAQVAQIVSAVAVFEEAKRKREAGCRE